MSKKSSQTPKFYAEDAVYYASACAPMRAAAKSGAIDLRALTHGHYFGESVPDDALPGLCTVGTWDARDDQNWTLDWHRNEGVELNFQASGHNVFQTSEREFQLESGDLVFVAPWRLHRFGVPHICRGVRVWTILDLKIDSPNSPWIWPSWIILTDADKKRLMSIILGSINAKISLSTKRAELWRELLKELRRDPGARPNFSRIAILLNEIFYTILETGAREDALEPSDTSFTLRVIRDFLFDFEARPQFLRHRWTATQMARKCGMSPASFFVHFRDLTNSTPNQYLNAARVRKAVELLEEDATRPIAEVANEVGFASGQYFATVFKKLIGLTPSDFVSRLQLKDSNVKPSSAGSR